MMIGATSWKLPGRQGCGYQSRIGRAVALNFIMEIIRTAGKEKGNENVVALLGANMVSAHRVYSI
jgi:hypothetical protein